MKFLYALAMILLGFGSYQTLAFSASSALSEQTAPIFDATSPGKYIPGRNAYVSLNYQITEARDVLVDFLDKTGSYTGVRKTINPASSYEYFTFRVPETMKDPDSAYVSIKLVPVGGAWWQKLVEVNLPVTYIRPKPINALLYYGYPLSYFETSFGRNYSNHDGVNVFVRKDQNTYEMGFAYGGYGREEKATMNLLNGEILAEEDNYSQGKISRVLHPASGGQEALDYAVSLRKIKEYFEYVEIGRGADVGADYTMLREANTYLRLVLLQVAPVAHDTLQFKGLHSAQEGPYPAVMRAGKTVSLSVKYATGTPRKLVVALVMEGKTVASNQVTLPAGEDNTLVPFQIPGQVKVHTNAQLSLKLFPQGGSYDHSTAETSAEVPLYPLNSLDHVYVGEEASSLDQLYMNVSYSIVSPMELWVDLYDPNAHKIDYALYPLQLGENASFYDFKFGPNIDLERGSTYKIIFKLMPKGSTADQHAVDQVVKYFKLID